MSLQQNKHCILQIHCCSWCNKRVCSEPSLFECEDECLLRNRNDWAPTSFHSQKDANCSYAHCRREEGRQEQSIPPLLCCLFVTHTAWCVMIFSCFLVYLNNRPELLGAIHIGMLLGVSRNRWLTFWWHLSPLNNRKHKCRWKQLSVPYLYTGVPYNPGFKVDLCIFYESFLYLCFSHRGGNMWLNFQWQKILIYSQ